MSTLKVLDKDFSSWKCSACNEVMQPAPIELAYLDSKFTVELPTCLKCGMVLVPEELALGKMAEVESLLEDK